MRKRSRTIPLAQLIEAVERIAPRSLAFSWDRVGLQVGDPGAPVRRVAVALEATEATVKEAIREKADLLIVHHPLIWQPLNAILQSDPVGRIVTHCVQNHLAVYAVHTNWDLGPHSMTQEMGRLLGLCEVKPLYCKPQPAGLKIVVFVPESDLAMVRQAMAEAGAGVIGNYTSCSFSSEGTGTFFGQEGAQPTLGRPGQLESVSEIRLEMVLPPSRLGSVVTAMIDAHPYEEPAYDIYKTEPCCSTGHLIWTARLSKSIELKGLAVKVRRALEVPRVDVVGKLNAPIRAIALCSGSGKGLIQTVAGLSVDVLITGDIDYHTARDAEARGVNVIDAGHFHTEKSFPMLITAALSHLPELQGVYFEAVASEESPFQVL